MSTSPYGIKPTNDSGSCVERGVQARCLSNLLALWCMDRQATVDSTAQTPESQLCI